MTFQDDTLWRKGWVTESQGYFQEILVGASNYSLDGSDY